MAEATVIHFPFGDADTVSIADAATSVVDIVNAKTFVKKTGGFAQAVTGLGLRASKDLRIGAEVVIDIKQGATGRNVTLAQTGSPVLAPALTGVALDQDKLTLDWDGTTFVAKTAAWQKVHDEA